MIHSKIKVDKNLYMLKSKKSDTAKKSKDVLQLVLGECDRIDSKRLLDDTEIVKLLKKMIEAEKITSNRDYFIKLLKTYIPAEVSKDEVIAWIKENIDFSQFKNKMQATGIVLKHFGSRVDGKVVSSIIKDVF